MNGALLLIISIVLFVIAYIGYGGYLTRKWGVQAGRPTPAHTLRDDVDYCPADVKVILGHHFSSIAGAAPITGPIQAIIFGWLPVYLWVLVGNIFFGSVHDYGAVFASLRHEGKSIGEVVKRNIGPAGKLLFNLFSWLALVLVVAAFTDICAGTFAYDPAVGDLTGARAGTASVLFIILAVLFGYLVYRKNANLVLSTIIGVAALAACIWIGYSFPVLQLSKLTWTVIVLLYIVCASVMPVWILLQPRDYLCSFLLYAVLLGGIAGLLITRPALELPAYTGFAVGEGTAVQYLFPILFITVACGAISGFHSLVASGTTSKQINKEKDARLIGYGAMLIEGVVAVIAICSVAYTATQAEGTPAVRFACGVAHFMSGFGIPQQIGVVFVTLSFSAFALTSVDTATRIARYMFQELMGKGESRHPAPWRAFLQHPLVGTVITVGCGAMLVAYGYTKIWPIFGASNQLLAAMTLMALTVWFAKTGKTFWPTAIPMVIMFCVTFTALALLARSFFADANWLMGGIAAVLFLLAVIQIAITARAVSNKEMRLRP